MSDTPGRPNWQRMTPQDFGARAKASQDALFLIDEPDAFGTDVLDGCGFGAALWADQPVPSAVGADAFPEYPRRVVESDGTVHAARQAADRNHVTTKCAEHPDPVIDGLECSSDRKVTCRNCTQ